MSEQPKPEAPVAGQFIPIAEGASANAPIVFFDVASAYGCYNNVVHVTVEATRFLPTADSRVATDRVITAHLRMNVQAAESLLRALQGALLLGQPVGSEAQN